MLWNFSSEPESNIKPIDFWDYHNGSLVIQGSTLYTGLDNGSVISMDPKTGKLQWQIQTEDASPVKSGLWIDGSTLYFGDWNGLVYAYDIKTQKKLWSHKTYDEKPYNTFGVVNAEITTHGEALFFGSRNPTMNVLNKSTGANLWSYAEQDGGWISGDPLILDGVLYIGGSDNHQMQAFDATTGERKWGFVFLNNCFSKPLPIKDLLLFTTGDAYNVYGNKPGEGYLYAVKRQTGELVNFTRVGGNLYTSLVQVGDALIAGSEDGKLYGIDLEKFLTQEPELRKKGYQAVSLRPPSPQPFSESIQLNYTVNYPCTLIMSITTLDEEPVTTLVSKPLKAGTYSATWRGLDSNDEVVKDGHYFVSLKVGQTRFKTFIQKKTKAETKPENSP